MIAAVVLAAGRARRMGFPKLLLQVGGKSLLRRVVDNALRSPVGEVVVVLGHGAEELKKELAGTAARIVLNPAYEEGMSTSLKAGLAAVSPAAEAAVVLLADQPLVGPEVVGGLVEKYRQSGRRIVAPEYAGRRGQPVLFDRSLFGELMAVEGDVGGREVISRHQEEVATVPFPSADLDYDVDTWEDYEALGR